MVRSFGHSIRTFSIPSLSSCVCLAKGSIYHSIATVYKSTQTFRCYFRLAKIIIVGVARSVPEIPIPFKWTRRSGGMFRSKISAVSHGEPDYLTYFAIVL